VEVGGRSVPSLTSRQLLGSDFKPHAAEQRPSLRDEAVADFRLGEQGAWIRRLRLELSRVGVSVREREADTPDRHEAVVAVDGLKVAVELQIRNCTPALKVQLPKVAGMNFSGTVISGPPEKKPNVWFSPLTV
jgi:hypothetical protein